MRFRRVPLAEAEGHILGHNVSEGGRRLLRKGGRLSAADVARLAEAGLTSVYVAEISPDDVNEDAAAERIASALVGQSRGLSSKPLGTGRVALRAAERGVVHVSLDGVVALSSVPGVTLATAPAFSVAERGGLVATLKIIPFALPSASVERAVAIAAGAPLVVRPLVQQRVRLVVSGSRGQESKLLPAYRDSFARRLSALGQSDVAAEFVALASEPEAELGAAIARQLDAGAGLVIVAGETATMDRDDLTAVAVERAGGRVAAFGAPVFPGNLLLLAYRGAQAIVGAPGCARARARNVVDLVLPRLLAGEQLGPREVAALGPGGLIGGAADSVEARDVTEDDDAHG